MTEALTLTDWAKRLDPQGKVDKIVELLVQTNEILDDMLWVEGNLPTGHRTTVRTGLPTVTWRKLNYGVQPSKSKTKQVDDTCGMLEAFSQVDVDLAKLNGNTPEFRLSEDKPFLEAMNQDMAGGMFYYDTDLTPEKFLGLAPRYPYDDAPNVIDGGGDGVDLTSIWLVVWGPDTVHGIFPKGSKVGIQSDDVGQGRGILVEDDQTPPGKYLAYVTHYKWDAGLTVRDWRYIVRIANIETSGSTNIFDANHLIEAYNLIPNIGKGKPVIYCNRTIKTQIDKDVYSSTNRMFTIVKDAFGRPVTEFWGIPIRRVDQLLDSESEVTATP